MLVKCLGKSDWAYANFLRIFALTIALTGCVQQVRPVAQGEQLTIETIGPMRLVKKLAVSAADRSAIERIVAEMAAARREQNSTP